MLSHSNALTHFSLYASLREPHELKHLNISETDALSLRQKKDLRALIQDGLPLVSEPYALLAEKIHANEKQVLDCITQWQQEGLIKRFGMVVNHHKLGYVANAMVVWNVPDKKVDDVAAILSAYDAVTLCYRRRRQLPQWPYNLFCMIHGKNRETVLAYIDRMVSENHLNDIDHSALFSTKQYKQRGGRYISQGAA